ncbi:MAG TPA: hypothetical protein VMU87_08575 [Stellaceae bacterium]|nr:hypothetical protein [Stellaceae bacterium]
MTVCEYTQNRRLWVRLREKGGKAGTKGPMFRTIGRGPGQLTRTPLRQANTGPLR